MLAVIVGWLVGWTTRGREPRWSALYRLRLEWARTRQLSGKAKLQGRAQLPQAAQICPSHWNPLLTLLLLLLLTLSPQLGFHLFHGHDLLHTQLPLLRRMNKPL